MALRQSLNLKLSQSLVMTPQLQQAIKLLQLNRLELAETINQELMENPILEEVSDTSEGDSIPQSEETGGEMEGDASPEADQRRDEEAFTNEPNKEDQLVAGKDDFNWDAYIEDFNSTASTAPNMSDAGGEDMPTYENVLTKSASIEEHLMWQLSMVTLAPQELKLGELIIGNLSDDGYLNTPLADLALQAEVELDDAEELLLIIQNFDPVGVASRDLRECLLTQAQFMNPRQPLVEKIIDLHLGDLEKRSYPPIAKSLGLPLEKIIEAIRLIQELEPRPGRSFQTTDAHYITPDIYVVKVGDDYAINLNEDGLPKLRISPYYKDILAAGNKAPPAAPPKEGVAPEKTTKEYVQERLRSAVWLIRSIQNRQKTIYKVTEAIVKRQRDFFEKGVQSLKPMILKDVAADIGMHESTISRVTTNKYVHTPVGIFELKYFFNSSINASDGSDSLASEAVKQKIKTLVTKEDPKNPLSDQKIVELLKNDNVDIARRTVAKYRDMLGILPSSRRKNVL